ncbi:hypothetical protein FNU79_17470 [Deinococcus detaillensis]|uniref:Uncharacterized protein n=1 Tax=Deinococcus detaillensis TaxID=2592048 RepID=A0A553UHV8_9DEIO|nr:hypothetical protein [Deinococcus detaillensis]TSA79772.1 hypothetical protein FNU79_17470 [Deinococcus detaillensis]
MNKTVQHTFWERELQRGLSGLIVAPMVLLVLPSLLVPLLPGRLPLVLLLSLGLAVLSYLGLSRRWFVRSGRDPLDLGGWRVLVIWLFFTSVLTGLISLVWK